MVTLYNIIPCYILVTSEVHECAFPMCFLLLYMYKKRHHITCKVEGTKTHIHICAG